MTSNGEENTETTGKNSGDSRQQKGYIRDDNGEKIERKDEEEVVFQKTEQGTIPTRQSGLDKYWTAVKNGASGAIAKVKEEKTASVNSFDALNEENEWEEEMEFENDFQEEGKGREIHLIQLEEVVKMEHSDVAETLYTYFLGKRLGATRKVYYLMEEEEAKKQLVELINEQKNMDVEPKKYGGTGRNVQTIHLAEIEKMKHQDVAETLYGYDIQQNKNVMREEYYSMEEKKAKVQLIQIVNMVHKNNFLGRIHKVIGDIKTLDVSLTTKEMGQAIIMEVCELSEIKYIKCKTDAATRKKLYQYQEYIAMIENFIKDPVMPIPEHMFQLGNASDIQVVEADYFKLVLAVVVAKVSEDGTTQLTMRQLRIKAMKLKRGIQKEKNSEVNANEQKPKKKPKTGDKEDEKQGKTLNSEYQQQKQEINKQDQNMRGLDVESVIPNEEEIEGPNFSLPVKEKKVKVVQKEKTKFMIHNKIHVTEKAKAHKIVQMVFRVLRRADPTVNIMPFTTEEKSQNNNLDQEDQIPETEEDLKKWIDIARYQLKDKFVFSMRISITEPKEVVKRRIFQWCRGQKHFIEFKRLTSANIFFAGWLYHIHPKYHNRDDVREWMANSDTVLKEDIHLAPGRIFKTLDDEEKTTLITHGLRVEVTFERRDAVLKALFSLNWENGPYRKSCFVPYRKNENYTDDMQEKFIKQHQQYIKNTKQTVFRMKAPRWNIQNRLEGKQTTFQKWIQSSRVNNERIVDSLEIGDDEYVRIIYQQQHDQGIKLLMRNLQNETERTFGKDVREKLFSSRDGGPITGSLAALEEDYAHKLERVLDSSNPQNDDDDYIPPAMPQTRAKNQVYFGNQMDETFADKVKNKKTTNTTKGEKNGDKKMESKKEILDEVNELIDKRMEKFERKVNKNIKMITEKQDEKISSLEDLVTKNYEKSEVAAQKRNEEIKEHMNSHMFFMESLSKHFKIPMKPPSVTQGSQKPPAASVEQSSREGGSQE